MNALRRMGVALMVVTTLSVATSAIVQMDIHLILTGTIAKVYVFHCIRRCLNHVHIHTITYMNHIMYFLVSS